MRYIRADCSREHSVGATANLALVYESKSVITALMFIEVQIFENTGNEAALKTQG